MALPRGSGQASRPPLRKYRPFLGRVSQSVPFWDELPEFRKNVLEVLRQLL